MHVRVRLFGKPDTIVVVESKLTKIDHFCKIIQEKFDVEPKNQRLFYGGKLLENGYTFHDYNIKLNDVIQLMVKSQVIETASIQNIKTKNDLDDYNPNISNVKYEDAVSKFYNVGDHIDMRDQKEGAWFEGKIVRIVNDPNSLDCASNSFTNLLSASSMDKHLSDVESDFENNPPTHSSFDNKNTISRYLTKNTKGSKTKQKNKESITKVEYNKIENDQLLYQIQLEADDEDSDLFCKINSIRPRARKIIHINDLKIGMKVMINHNIEEPSEKGYWYDFKVDKIKKNRLDYELVGTLYLGPGEVTQNETCIKLHDRIYAIEEVLPLEIRTEDYNKLMTTPTAKRSSPLNCLTCRDDEDAPCKDCGCFICLGKEYPEKIILCDECNYGYHMKCLSPPLTELPEEDWYCPSCKRDPNDVIAPGAAKQKKKITESKSSRDWGRGMACAGKTKTCAMPPNHFGPIPGIEVGMCWRFRIQLSESGVHRPPVSGIHGRDVEGAYSIVLSGGYEDDVDNGNEFTYTGSGGRDLSGNKRTAEQSCDQTLTRENKALARNCAVKLISEDGADAGDNWQNGKPVRVVRSYKMLKHFPKYAPKEGIRYDGIYKVVKYYPEKGLSGFRVWKYLLRRDDPSPAPWEEGAKNYPIVYPDGYLEAEAEKKALKEKSAKNSKPGKGTKKRALQDHNQSTESDTQESPPVKKRKIVDRDTKEKKKGRLAKNKSVTESPKSKCAYYFKAKSPKKSVKDQSFCLTSEEKVVIHADIANAKLWEECLVVCDENGKKEFIEHVTQAFLCIICQDVAVNPVTTPCHHNFCLSCIKQAFKCMESRVCPHCRRSLTNYEPESNEKLKLALQTILPGYDAGKK
ncbi:hypothetical protein ACJJTC_000932 [Scirpophaga incertulas]